MLSTSQANFIALLWIFIGLPRYNTLLPFNAFRCLSNLYVHLGHMTRDIIVLDAQVIEHMIHSGVDLSGDLV